MLKAERRSEILKIIFNGSEATVSDLCARFHVSAMTIRRDLRELEREGLLRRVHGGAIGNFGRSYEPTYTNSEKSRSQKCNWQSGC